MFRTTLALGLLLLATAVPAQPPALLTIPPPPPPPAYNPLPGLPDIPLDESNNRVGVAQMLAREKHLQGRLLWVDATANIERINTPEEIRALAGRIHKAGFNTVVLDVKPIIGMTLYPSKYAKKLTEWNKAKLPEAFDPLAEMVKAMHAEGLGLMVNLSIFSEGHRGMQKGPAYEHPEWQSTLCDPQLVVNDLKTRTSINVAADVNVTPQSLDEATAYTSTDALAPSPEAAVVTLDAARRVVEIATGAMAKPAIPKGGAVLLGEGQAGDFLRRVAVKGDVLPMQTAMRFVPMTKARVPGSSVWVNPHNPEVVLRSLDMVTEVMAKYALDGIVFDDRMRYSGINADFSEATRTAFEQYVGKPLQWPDDVLRCDIAFPSMATRLIPGPYLDTWILWRATNLRNWVAKAAAAAKAARPAATVGVYVGSWYGEYPAFGANWAADDFQAGFRFLTEGFRKTGFAGLVDWIAPGCYYQIPTVADALRTGASPGQTIEAAAQFGNRAANDQAWVYAGIVLEKLGKSPDALARALQAATGATQGVMVFDLSHGMDALWPVFEKAFAQPARAPHAAPGLLAEVRAKHAQRKAAGIADPPVIIQQGLSGTGL